jgi:hypothetical protein
MSVLSGLMSSDENEEVVRRTSSSARRRKTIQIEDHEDEDEDEEVSRGMGTKNTSQGGSGTGLEHGSWKRGWCASSSMSFALQLINDYMIRHIYHNVYSRGPDNLARLYSQKSQRPNNVFVVVLRGVG